MKQKNSGQSPPGACMVHAFLQCCDYIYCSVQVNKKRKNATKMNCPNTIILCMVHERPHHYSWSDVPQHHRTERQILKRHRRLKKHAQSVGTITLIFDKPRCRPKYVEPVPPEECEQLRQNL